MTQINGPQWHNTKQYAAIEYFFIFSFLIHLKTAARLGCCKGLVHVMILKHFPWEMVIKPQHAVAPLWSRRISQSKINVQKQLKLTLSHCFIIQCDVLIHIYSFLQKSLIYCKKINNPFQLSLRLIAPWLKHNDHISPFAAGFRNIFM